MMKTILVLCLVGFALSQQSRFNNRRRFDSFNHRNQVQEPQVQLRQQPRPRPHEIPVNRFNRPFARLLRDNKDGPFADGSYYFDFASDDGITRTETGRNAGRDPRSGYDIHTKTGSYSYTSPEGIPIDVQYVANENGFTATSPVLPLGPKPPQHAIDQILAAKRAFARRGQVFVSGFDNHPSIRG